MVLYVEWQYLQMSVSAVWSYFNCYSYLTSTEMFLYTDSPEKDSAARKREEENQVLDELMSDISRDETDHLDFEMTDEKQFLDDYLARLSSLK